MEDVLEDVTSDNFEVGVLQSNLKKKKVNSLFVPKPAARNSSRVTFTDIKLGAKPESEMAEAYSMRL